MAFIAESRRNKFWFGTESYSLFFPTPNRGADVSPSGWSSTNELLNGGAHQLNSFGSHKNYIFEWPSSSSREVAQLMKSFSDGTYGRGLIYFQDPLTWDTNVLPAMWADPSIGLGQEGASLVYGVEPATTPTSNWRANMLPVNSAFYNLSGVTPGWRGKEDAVFVPIPEGYSLSLGAFYQFSGSGGLFYRTQSQSGALGGVQGVTPLPNNSSEVLNTLIGGSNISGVWLFVGRSTSANSSVTLTAMIARLIETSKTVTQKVATNLFTNPRLKGDGTWAEVRRNLATNPSFEGGAGQPSDVPSSSTVTMTTTDESPYVGSRAMRLTATTVGALSLPITSAPTVEGVVYTIVMHIRPVGRPVTLLPRIAANVGSAVTVPADVWTEVRYTAAAGSGNVIQTGGTVLASNGHAVGDVIDIDAVMLVEGEYTGPYFDGSTTLETAGDVVQPEDFRWRWVGTPNASESVMEIENVAGLIGFDAIAGVSTRGGKPAVRIIPTGSGMSLAHTLVPVAVSSVTAVGTVSLDAPLQGTLDDLALTLIAGGVWVTAPNLAGDHPLRVMGVESSSANVLFQLIHGGTRGSGDVWWTDIGLFEGEYNGPAFSGDTGAVVINGRNLRTQWDGTPDNSTSSAWTRTPGFDKLKLGPWIGGQGNSGVRFVGKPTYIENTGVNGGQVGFAASFAEVGSWLYG